MRVKNSKKEKKSSGLLPAVKAADIAPVMKGTILDDHGPLRGLFFKTGGKRELGSRRKKGMDKARQRGSGKKVEKEPNRKALERKRQRKQGKDCLRND